MCMKGGIIAVAAGTSLLGPLALLGVLLALLHHVEKKERRRAERRPSTQSLKPENTNAGTVTKTVTVENKGPLGGTAGVAEIVTTGPNGRLVSTVPTTASGTAVVSTHSAGVPGTVSVDVGRTAIVTAEHPVGLPEQAVVTSTVQL